MWKRRGDNIFNGSLGFDITPFEALLVIMMEPTSKFLNFFSKPMLVPPMMSLLRHLLSLRPSVLWICPWTITFYAYIIYSSDNLNEAIVIPSGAPRISDIPVLCSVLDTIPHNWYGMIQILCSCMINKDASTRKVEEIWGDCNWTSYRAILQFLNHVLLTTDKTISFHLIFIVAFLHKTSLVWITVLTYYFRRAWDSIIMTPGLVICAGFVCYVIVVDPGECTVLVSTVTTIVSLVIARDENLWS